MEARRPSKIGFISLPRPYNQRREQVRRPYASNVQPILRGPSRSGVRGKPRGHRAPRGRNFAHAGVSFPPAEGVVRKHSDYKRVARRHVPPAAELRARLEQLIAVYKDKCDPHGHCILHEHALRTIQNQLAHVDSHSVSDDADGVCEKTGTRTISVNGCDVTLTTWRSLRGLPRWRGPARRSPRHLGRAALGCSSARPNSSKLRYGGAGKSTQAQ